MQHEQNNTEPDCDNCKQIQLIPENEQAWAFFQEVFFWSQSGFTKDGLVEAGDTGSGLNIVLQFLEYQLTEYELYELYKKLKIIYSAIREVNNEKGLEKRAD